MGLHHQFGLQLNGLIFKCDKGVCGTEQNYTDKEDYEKTLRMAEGEYWFEFGLRNLKTNEVLYEDGNEVPRDLALLQCGAMVDINEEGHIRISDEDWKTLQMARGRM